MFAANLVPLIPISSFWLERFLKTPSLHRKMIMKYDVFFLRKIVLMELQLFLAVQSSRKYLLKKFSE